MSHDLSINSLDVPDELQAQAASLRNGEKPRATVRELLKWFGAERRCSSVVMRVRDALDKKGLVTWPDFEGEYIDQEVFFMDKRSFQPPAPVPPPGGQRVAAIAGLSVELRGGVIRGITAWRLAAIRYRLAAIINARSACAVGRISREALFSRKHAGVQADATVGQPAESMHQQRAAS